MALILPTPNKSDKNEIKIVPERLSKSSTKELGMTIRKNTEWEDYWKIVEKRKSSYLIIEPRIITCPKLSVGEVIKSKSILGLKALDPSETLKCILEGIISLNGVNIYSPIIRGIGRKEGIAMYIWEEKNWHYAIISGFSKKMSSEKMNILFCKKRIYIA